MTKKKHILDLNNQFINHREVAALLHKTGSFANQLLNYIQQHAIDDSIVVETKEGKTHHIPIFHYGTKNGKGFGLYMFEKALPNFLKKHMENLIELGLEREKAYAFLGLIPQISADEKKHHNLCLLNKIAGKISSNPRVVPLIAKHIKNTYLTETFFVTDEETGQTRKESMFIFAPSKLGKSALYLKSEAVDEFLKRYKGDLKKLAAKLNEENEFVPLRGFAIYLGSYLLEKQLFDFIIKHLDEHVEIQEENGKTKSVKMFNTEKHGSFFYINVYKKGMDSFIKKYQKELTDIGFGIVPVITQGFDKKDLLGNLISLKTLSKKLTSDETKQACLTAAMTKHFHNETVKGKKTGETKPLFLNYRNTLRLKKENVAYFIKKHKKWFLSQGIDMNIINNITGEKPFVTKTNNTPSFKEFGQLLKCDYYKLLECVKFINENCLDETYTTTNNKEKPIFANYKVPQGVKTCFSSKKAMQAFLKKHKETFVQFGFKREFLEQVSGEKTYTPITEDFLYLSDLKKYLHIRNINLNDYVSKNCLNDTYTVSTPNGEQEKPMFQFKAGKRIGFGDYAIEKQAIFQFILKHGKALNINPFVQEAFFHQMPIKEKQDSYLTIPLLTELLGKNSVFYKKLSTYIKENIIHATEPVNNEPLFNFGYTLSGQTSLYFDGKHLSHFLSKYQNALIELGFRPAKISKVLQQSLSDNNLANKLNLKNLNRNRQRLKIKSTQNQREN